MNSPQNKSRDANGPGANVSLKRPVAPPVYRPQVTPKVLQPKAPPIRPVNQTRVRPVAPPVYHVQPVPKVLQTKSGAAMQRPSASSALTALSGGQSDNARRFTQLRNASDLRRMDERSRLAGHNSAPPRYSSLPADPRVQSPVAAVHRGPARPVNAPPAQSRLPAPRMIQRKVDAAPAPQPFVLRAAHVPSAKRVIQRRIVGVTLEDLKTFNKRMSDDNVAYTGELQDNAHLDDVLGASADAAPTTTGLVDRAARIAMRIAADQVFLGANHRTACFAVYDFFFKNNFFLRRHPAEVYGKLEYIVHRYDKNQLTRDQATSALAKFFKKLTPKASYDDIEWDKLQTLTTVKLIRLPVILKNLAARLSEEGHKKASQKESNALSKEIVRVAKAFKNAHGGRFQKWQDA